MDFGDGRKIVRTVTGNAIHYILDSQGQFIDGIPGLYSPKAFQTLLQRGVEWDDALALKTKSSDRYITLKQLHAQANVDLQNAWVQDNQELQELMNKGAIPKAAPKKQPQPAVATALEANRRAFSKGIEIPNIKAILNLRDYRDIWEQLSMLPKYRVNFDFSSYSLMQRKHPNARQAVVLAITKSRVELPALSALAKFSLTVAQDSLRNEYDLHATIHEWVIRGESVQDLDRLNTKVYAELFLTPDSDPWLGLNPKDLYAALPDNGMQQ